MASIYVASIAACGTHPFCFSPSATFKPHGGKQPPPHHHPPIPPLFSFLYLTLPKRRRQTPLSPLSCSSLSFYNTLSPFIKTILSPARPLFSVRFFLPQSPFSPNISLPSAQIRPFPENAFTEHGLLCNKISFLSYFGRISCSAIALALHTKRPPIYNR